ncbi:MAG TPA: PaaI family thioesterase [Acidimicrobiales bacterium]|nr:PaaI family thioesterase [Acidimicrobiales bacterium]
MDPTSDGRWTFGVEPLPQALEMAPLLRRIAGLVQSLDRDEAAVAELLAQLRDAEHELERLVPPDTAPRLGMEATDHQRPYVDHARDIGAYNPCFPEYEIVVEGPWARGAVTFPLAFEGPPGIVHGGVLATFFDCVVQHHNCDVGVAGRTTSLLVEFRRPVPLDVALDFEIDRATDRRRITSHARLRCDAELLCTATIEAVAGERARLPHVPPRPAP